LETVAVEEDAGSVVPVWKGRGGSGDRMLYERRIEEGETAVYLFYH